MKQIAPQVSPQNTPRKGSTFAQRERNALRQRLLCALTLGVLAGSAVGGEEPLNLEFTGTLVTPPACSLNENGTIAVSFGDKVGIRKVPTGVYREPVALTVQCDETSLAWQLMLSVTGNPAGFDSDGATVVTAEQAALGVKLYLAGKPFVLDKPVKVNSDTPWQLEALLVQQEDSLLEEGPFTAQAILRAEYQ